MRAHIAPATHLAGRLRVPGDKSISHRALFFAALADNPSRVHNLGPGADVRATLRCLGALGVDLELDGASAQVHGVGRDGFEAPAAPLDCGNSGTSMRLLAGIVAGAGLGAELDGDASLRRRPMRRILAPLRAMGARVTGRPAGDDEVAPLRFEAGPGLCGCRHELRVASAQLKSALLLAGLWATGQTTVVEAMPTRDHSERMLRGMGAAITTYSDGAITIEAVPTLRAPEQLTVPGDPSTAAFFAAAATLVGSADLTIEGVDNNPGRAGFLGVLQRMGATLDAHPRPEQAGDPVVDLELRHRGMALHATDIDPAEVPSLVDEIPILAVVATQAEGRTRIRGARELRLKESDRLAAMARGLQAMGARVEERPDGLVVDGPTRLHHASVDSAGDHRIAMSFAVAGLVAAGGVEVSGAEWMDVSCPGFLDHLERLRAGP